MENIVVSIGGSIVAPTTLDVEYIDALSKMLVEVAEEGHKIYCVTGGGWVARQYIQAARTYGAAEEELDLIGIAATRINSQLLIAALQKYTDVPVRPMTSVAGTIEAAKGYSVAVMGGTFPGHSTDYVGAELAAQVKAVRFVNATNVDGIYSADPNVVATADFYEEVDASALIKMMGVEWKMAGAQSVIDGPACVMLRDKRIPTIVVNGKNLPEFAKALRGQKFHGTTVVHKPLAKGDGSAPAPAAA